MFWAAPTQSSPSRRDLPLHLAELLGGRSPTRALPAGWQLLTGIGLQALLAQGIFYLQLALIGLLVAGDWVFDTLGIQPPELYLRYKVAPSLCCPAALLPPTRMGWTLKHGPAACRTRSFSWSW